MPMDFERFAESVDEMCMEAHANAVAHGFYEVVPSIPTRLMLMVTELAEAMEEYRNGKPVQYVIRQIADPEAVGGVRIVYVTDPDEWMPNEKPEGLASELADVFIRVMDTCAEQGIDLGKLTVKKHLYNKTRSHMHGGKIL